MKLTSAVDPTLLYINSETVVAAKAGIQIESTGFPRIEYGAGLVKPGTTIKVKELLTQYIGKPLGSLPILKAFLQL
jgi:hypothetical protein